MMIKGMNEQKIKIKKRKKEIRYEDISQGSHVPEAEERKL